MKRNTSERKGVTPASTCYDVEVIFHLAGDGTLAVTSGAERESVHLLDGTEVSGRLAGSQYRRTRDAAVWKSRHQDGVDVALLPPVSGGRR
jgi:hypothetical protein